MPTSAGQCNTSAETLQIRALSALDVGCGVAGIDVLLDRTFESEMRSICLLDRDEVSDVHYAGFRNRAAAYSSLSEARRLLVSNRVPQSIIQTIDMNELKSPVHWLKTGF